MIMGLEKAEELISSIRKHTKNPEESSSLMLQLIAAQNQEGNKMLRRALTADAKVPESTIIKIPDDLLQKLPNSFQPQVIFPF